MNLAIVHDHLSQNGGAEQVLSALQSIWPKAPTYALFFDDRKFPHLKGKDVRTSFLQRAPLMRAKYQWYVGLMPTATESYDLSGFDVVVSNASAFSKGVLTRPGTVHVCYCHTPTRYLWLNTHSYVQELRAPGFVKALLPPLLSYLRIWDRHAAERPDVFVANSKTVQERIKAYYGRDSVLLYPPVDTQRFSIAPGPKEYFLAGGRLVAYKRFDLIVEACSRLGLPLKIFGTGPMEAELKKAAGPTVEFLGYVKDGDMPALYAGAKAFIHPQEEDFGITAVESMAAGRPVVAYGKGGAGETVIPGKTGLLFDQQNWETVGHLLLHFDEAAFDPAAIKTHAETFSRARFEDGMKRIVEEARQKKTAS